MEVNQISTQHPHEPDAPPVIDTEGRCMVCAIEDSTHRLARLVAMQARQIDALVDGLKWCSGSADFNEGGQAREGWLVLMATLRALGCEI